MLLRSSLPEFDRLFADFFGPRWTAELPGPSALAVNLYEDEANLYVEADLPGVAMSDLELSLEQDQLLLKYEPKAEDTKDVRFHRRERGTRAFRRALSLPVPVEAERVTARLVDGVLTVTLPKAAIARPRRIEVQGR